MGREKKHKPRRARGGRVPRQPEGERFSSVGHAIKTGQIKNRPDVARFTVQLLVQTYVDLNQQSPGGPACGGPVLIHADGAFQCTAGCPGSTEVLHVPEALHFCDYADQLGIHADELGHICPQCTATGAAGHGRAITLCTGIQVDHQDGTATCTLGDDCPDPEAIHASGQTCGLFDPCDHCGITAPRIR